jgi:para-aminobenzoate synthetase component I
VHDEPLELNEPFVDLCARFARCRARWRCSAAAIWIAPGTTCWAFVPGWQLSGRNGQVRLRVDQHEHRIDAAPLDVLAPNSDRCTPARRRSWPAPLAAGLMGYLAYDLKDDLEHLPRTSVDDLQLPHMLFYAPSLLVVHDKHSGQTRLLMPLRPQVSEAEDQLMRWFHHTRAAPAPADTGFRLPEAGRTANFTQAGLPGAVRRVIDYIAAGDVYQVNLSQRFQFPFDGDAFALFKHLYAANPAPFFAFIQGGDHQIVSTSPERFLLQDRPPGGNAARSRAPARAGRPPGRTPSCAGSWSTAPRTMPSSP